MLKRIVCFAAALVFATGFAARREPEYKMYYYTFDSDGRLHLADKSVKVVADGLSDAAFAVFERFFADEDISFKPDGVRVIGTDVRDGHLTLNVSSDINQYGGAYYEVALKSQIIRTALNIDGVDAITLLIDGGVRTLAEGSVIRAETAWKNLSE